MNFQSILVLSALILAAADFVSSTDKYKEQSAIEGSSYKMKCTDADNSPSRPYIIWTVNGKPPRGQKYKLLTDGLVIRNVSAEDTTANYTCTLLDRFSLAPLQSESLKLRIRQRSGKLLENQVAVSKGRTLKLWGVLNQWKTLQCIMYSRPSPTFQWKNKISRSEIRSTPDLFRIEEADGTSNLTIFIRNDSMFGEYVCEGSNNLGSSVQHFSLVKGYKPAAPFIFPTFIAKDRVAFKVESQVDITSVDRDMLELLPIISYVIQFKTVSFDEVNSEKDNHQTLWITVSEADKGHEGTPYILNNGGGTLEVRQLKENTTYLVRSAVGNAAAMSDFSTAVRVTTEASPVNISSKSNDEETNMELLHQEEKDRREHGRSTGEMKVTSKLGTTKNETVVTTCTSPRFKKTVMITTTSTTLIEDISGTGTDNNSSLIKRLVVEDTTINREHLCTL